MNRTQQIFKTIEKDNKQISASYIDKYLYELDYNYQNNVSYNLLAALLLYDVSLHEYQWNYIINNTNLKSCHNTFRVLLQTNSNLSEQHFNKILKNCYLGLDKDCLNCCMTALLDKNIKKINEDNWAFLINHIEPNYQYLGKNTLIMFTESRLISDRISLHTFKNLLTHSFEDTDCVNYTIEYFANEHCPGNFNEIWNCLSDKEHWYHFLEEKFEAGNDNIFYLLTLPNILSFKEKLLLHKNISPPNNASTSLLKI